MRVKRILILGSGGREDVIASAYIKNKNIEKVYIAPGNGLTGFRNKKIISLPEIPSNDFNAVVSACKELKIDLVDVAQDEPLALGFVDKLKSKNIKAFGASKDASEVEWNKDYSRNFMQKYNIPTPSFASFSNLKKAKDYITSLKEQELYVKASGLALGKGAIYAANKKEAIVHINSMKNFGKAGETFLIEECMIGEEFSLFAVCDGDVYIIVGAAQDHKTVYNGNIGPNTGGMGCVFPCLLVDKKITNEVEEKILKPFIIGMKKEKRPYSGILYIGGMVTANGIKVVEFNCRWGDPEAEVIIPSIKTDYLSIVEAVLNGRLKNIAIKKDNKVRVSVAGCALGYPQDYSKAKNKKIFGIENIPSDKFIYGSGIKKTNDRYEVSGGRILHMVGVGKSVLDARKDVYSTLSGIYVQGDNFYYRTDIGWRDIERLMK